MTHDPRSERSQPSQRLRPGFTLVELLVVIAIIAVLAALTVGATMRVIGAQSQKNTQLLVAKLGAALNQQWQAVVDQANKEPLPPAVMAKAGNDGALARVIWIKLRLKQQFPESFSEALSPDGGAGMIAADPYYAGLPATLGLPAAQEGAMENAVCLTLALKNSSRGSVFSVDNLSPRELGVLPGGTLQYLMDDWKVPIQFTKFGAWQNPDLNPSGAQTGPPWLDPVDPTGKLSSIGMGFGYPLAAGTSYNLQPYVWSTGGPSNPSMTPSGFIYSYKSLIGGYNQ